MENVVQGVNALGEFFLLSLGKGIYSREAIMKTCYAFTDSYYIQVVKVADETTGICFYDKGEENTCQDIRTGVKQFLQSLIENQMRYIIHQETSVLHQEIVRKTFSPAVVLIDEDSQSGSLNILTSAV
ncbi:MAG TPA: His-Xaa-Ser system protein HxsD [Lelliottia sp.]